MKQVVVREFGGPEVLEVVESPTPGPGDGQVCVRLTSIGMNHADLMGRRGQYKLTTGDPPFTPGLEGGGVVEAMGPNVTGLAVGDRVTLSPAAPRRERGGTYRSHMVVAAGDLLPVPDAVPDDQLGALWLTYLTAWGCLAWKHDLRPGAVVAIPAASSGVALATAQVVRHLGGTSIGLTTSPGKVDRLKSLDACVYDHLLVTHEADGSMKPWHREIRSVAPKGVDVFFDPVASGAYLETEIRCLAQRGVIWIYGLLGEPDVVDLTPLIRKWASIRAWLLGELIAAGEQAWRPACDAILAGFADGSFRQHVHATFPLEDVRRAHAEMEKGAHLGKLVLIP